MEGDGICKLFEFYVIVYEMTLKCEEKNWNEFEGKICDRCCMSLSRTCVRLRYCWCTNLHGAITRMISFLCMIEYFEWMCKSYCLRLLNITVEIRCNFHSVIGQVFVGFTSVHLNKITIISWGKFRMSNDDILIVIAFKKSTVFFTDKMHRIY
jgi:hypothetical protein